MDLPSPARGASPLPAIGPLRDFPSPAAGPAPTTPTISEYNNDKIRNICLLLSITVVFNHGITWGDLRLWQGESVSRPEPGEAAPGILEMLLELFVSGSLGRITNPVFFLVSGYLFFWAWRPDWPSLRRKWRRRTFSLLAPWLIWAVVGKLMWLADYLYTNRHALAVMWREGSWGGEELLLTFLGMHVPSQLWFLQQLMFLMVLVAPLLAVVLPRVRWWILPPLGVLYLLPGLDPLLVFRKSALCFFVLGALLGNRTHALTLPTRRHGWILTVLWLAVAGVYTGVAAFGTLPLTLLYKILVLAGVVGVWGAYDVLPGRLHRWLGVVAPYRFFVYMGFDPLLPILQKHWYGMFAATQASRIVAYLLFPTAAVLICLVAARALYRVMPGAYHVISGGRTPGVPRQDRGEIPGPRR